MSRPETAARLIKLREGERGPVYGVRTVLSCSCGTSFPVTLTAGVNRPAIWCPRCRRRSHLNVVWDLSGSMRGGPSSASRQITAASR